MRFKAGLVALGLFFLVIAGLKLDSLPYIRYEARYSDSVLAHWPNALFLRESVLLRHEFPVWRETTMAGQPFAANPLNKTAYPLQWLALILPPAVHLNLMIVVHLFIAGAGMWRWMRALRMRQEAVVLATVSYVFAPRMIGHLAAGHLDIVYALAWWPWLMWSVRQLFAQPQSGWRNGVQLGLIAALLIAADIRVSLFAFSVAAVYLVINSDLHIPVLAMRSALAGVIVSLLLAAAMIVPLILWQPFMNRSGMTVTDAGALSLEAGQLIGVLLPANHNAVEALTYVGLPVLILAVIGLFSRPRRQKVLGFLALSLVVIYALGLNGVLWPLLATLVPPLRWFRVPSRAWLILAVLAPAMAGYGLQWVLERVEDLHHARLFAGLSRFRLLTVSWMTLALLLGVFALVVLPQPATGLVVLVSGFSIGALLLAGFSKRLSLRWFAIGLVAVTCFDLFFTGYQWLDWRSPDYWLTPHKPLAERLVAAGAERIYSPTLSLEQQVAEVYGLQIFGGVDPFQLSGVVRAVEQGSGVPVTKYEVVLPPLTGIESDKDIDQANRSAVINTQVLGEWHVSHVVAAYSINNDRLQLLDRVGAVYIYHNLDYVPSQSLGAVPNWPADWPALPDHNTVQQINQITILVALVSGIAWIVCAGLFVY
jgi:hypothetical protein